MIKHEILKLLSWLKLINIRDHVDMVSIFQVVDLLDKDFSDKAPDGTLWISYTDCNDEEQKLFVQPDDTLSFQGCKNKPKPSYTGTMVWDGKKLKRYITTEEVE